MFQKYSLLIKEDTKTFSNLMFFFLEKTEKHQENEVNDEEFN
jgi:hypothetical protein